METSADFAAQNPLPFLDLTCCTGGILSLHYAGIPCLELRSAFLSAEFYTPVAIEVTGLPEFNEMMIK